MTRPVQTVTVSSEGPAAEVFPDSMGQYDILREVYRYDRPVYKHMDREDRFIIYTGRTTGLWLTDRVLLRIVVKFKRWCSWYFMWYFISWGMIGRKIIFKKIFFNSKVNSGTSHMTCLPKMETSEVLVKETYLFHSKDGNSMIAVILLFTISTNVWQKGPYCYFCILTRSKETTISILLILSVSLVLTNYRLASTKDNHCYQTTITLLSLSQE